MLIDDVTVSRSIIESYTDKLLANLQVDVAMVGAGPANMIACDYFGKAGIRAAIFESKLAPGGGMWGGGMMFNEVAIQEDAIHIADEIGLGYQKKGDGHYTMDSIEATSTIISGCVKAGTVIFNLLSAVDVLFREVDGQTRVAGLVLNWSPVGSLGLHVDPLGMGASYVVDGTGHPAEICNIVKRK